MDTAEEIATKLKKEFKINGTLWKSYCIQEIEEYAQSHTNEVLGKLENECEIILDESDNKGKNEDKAYYLYNELEDSHKLIQGLKIEYDC